MSDPQPQTATAPIVMARNSVAGVIGQRLADFGLDDVRVDWVPNSTYATEGMDRRRAVVTPGEQDIEPDTRTTQLRTMQIRVTVYEQIETTNDDRVAGVISSIEAMTTHFHANPAVLVRAGGADLVPVYGKVESMRHETMLGQTDIETMHLIASELVLIVKARL